MAAEEKQWVGHQRKQFSICGSLVILTLTTLQASKYLLDPLTEPEPNTESGPGSHFVPPQAMASSQHSHKSGASTQVKEQSTGSSRSSTNPFRRDSAVVAREASAKDGARIHHRFEDEKKGPTALTRAVSSGSNGFHAPRASSDLRHEAFPSEGPQRRSIDASRDNGKAPEGRRRRSSSLKQRYPGDPTDNPLGMLEKANLRANRSPHLRKQHQPRPDPIDALDESLGRYHHEGPYDAALFVRNTSSRSSPVIALSKSNREALKATPDDKIRDSLNDHRPLDGTAMVPPGQRDAFGRRYDYKEGTDMMRENGGDYKRWPGVVSNIKVNKQQPPSNT